MWCPSSGHSWRGYSAFAGARLPICSADHPMRGRTTDGTAHATYYTDRLGSLTALVSSQSLAASYTYDPWGEAIQGTGRAYNPFQFTSTYRDEFTGLYQMKARHQWLTRTFPVPRPHRHWKVSIG